MAQSNASGSFIGRICTVKKSISQKIKLANIRPLIHFDLNNAGRKTARALAFNEGWWFSWLECWPVTPEVAGSSPVHPAIEEAAIPRRVAAFLYPHGRDENPRSGVRPSSIREMGSFAKQSPRRGETSEASEYNPVHPAVFLAREREKPAFTFLKIWQFANYW